MMKQYLIIILIATHLFASSAYATKAFIDKDYLHNNIHECTLHEHQHHHSHNGSKHQHKHSHIQINISYADLLSNINDINLHDYENPKQTYIEIVSWNPNPNLESLFRPPKT